MLTIKKFKLLFTFFILTITTHFALAAPIKNEEAIKKLLSQTASIKDPQLIIDKINTLAPQVKKIDFPSNDPVLKNLTNYTFDTVKNTRFMRTYKKISNDLPKEVRRAHPWVEHLDAATSAPTEYLSTPLGNLVNLSACEPHNCPNALKILYNPKTNAAWGMLTIYRDKSYLLGKPNEEQIALLLIAMGDSIEVYKD